MRRLFQETWNSDKRLLDGASAKTSPYTIRFAQPNIVENLLSMETYYFKTNRRIADYMLQPMVQNPQIAESKSVVSRQAGRG